MTEQEDLYHKYRPKKLTEMVGQAASVKTMLAWCENNRIPRVVLFTGPSGTGKTTAARILRDKLKCDKDAYQEHNCALVDSPIELIRRISGQMGQKALAGDVKVYYLDEFQAWSKAGAAQNSLLKMLEDPPKGVYFFIAASDPSKIIAAIKTRCTKVNFKAIDAVSMKSLLKKVAAAEKIALKDEVTAKIVEAAEGSAREALVMLHTVRDLKSAKEQLEAIDTVATKGAAFDLFKVLMGWDRGRPCTWPNVAAVLKTIEEDPEGIRRAVMTIASTICLKADNSFQRAGRIMQGFQYDTFQTGKAGLILAAYECTQAFNQAKK